MKPRRRILLLALGMLAAVARAQLPLPTLPPLAASPEVPEPATAAPSAETPASAVESAPDAGTAGRPDADIGPRDPFLPVGYVPSKSQPPPGPDHTVTAPPRLDSDWERARSKLAVTGIVRIGTARDSNAPKYMAIINDNLVEEGDIVATTLNGSTFRWRIQAISSTGVSMQKAEGRGP